MSCTPILLALAAAVAGFALDESPPKPEEWGFRPAPGPVAVNPPGFVWRPERRAAAYQLQAARDGDFDAPALDAETGWSAHAPDAPLPPGEYRWRYRARDAGGAWTAWSAERPFSVPGDAVHLAKPGPAALAARVPADHPRLFLRPDEVESFRARTAGPLRARWQDVLAEADKILANPPDLAEPPLYPEGTVHKGKEWRDIWWGNRRRALAVGEAAATLGFAYLLGGDPRHGDAARDLTMALMEWDPKGSTQYNYNDEAAMPLVFLPARAYTFARDRFSGADRARLREVMRVRGEDCFNHLDRGAFLWRPYNSHSNRAWHKLGELALVFHDEIPDAPRWLDYALTKFFTSYPAWGVSDGGWHEGVSYWQSYLQRFVLYWAFTSQAVLDIDPFAFPFFQRTGDYGMHLLPPGMETGGFGDLAPPRGAGHIAQLMGLLAAGARNPHWQWHHEAAGGSLPGGYLGLIVAARAEGIGPVPPAGRPASAAFRDVGIAVLNTSLLDGAQGTQIHFKSSPFGRQSHGYNANNAFLLHHNGRPVFICSGRRDVHGSPHHTRWMWETKSDNAILFNGQGQRVHRADATGEITGFGTGPILDHVSGEAGKAYNHVDRWTRRILLFKPDVVVIHDVVEAPEPGQWSWLLHAPGPFEIAGADHVRWRGNGTAANLRAAWPPNPSITQHNEFDPPPHDWANFELDEWHLAIEPRDPRAREQFITVITLGERDEAAFTTTSEGGTHTLTLTLPDGPARIVLQPDSATVSGPGIAATLR